LAGLLVPKLRLVTHFREAPASHRQCLHESEKVRDIRPGEAELRTSGLPRGCWEAGKSPVAFVNSNWWRE
jgi:hypothetical protein